MQELANRLAAAGDPLPAHLEGVGRLTPYAVQTRYPGFDEPITDEQADEAINLAEDFLRWVSARIA